MRNSDRRPTYRDWISRRSSLLALGWVLPALVLLVASAPAWPTVGAQPVATPTSAAGTATGTSQPGGQVLPRGNAARAATAGPGAVFAWGGNPAGQLGDGTNLGSSTAVQVQGLTGVTAIPAGGFGGSALAARRDGTVAAWGQNLTGALGDGTTTNRNVPVRVATLPVGADKIVAVATGIYHSLGLTASGGVYAWGTNTDGQLGDGTFLGSTTPVRVKNTANSGNLANIVAVAAGGRHSLAVASDGTVYGWGFNLDYAVGDGTTTNRGLPVIVLGVGGTGALNVGPCPATGTGCVVAAGAFSSMVRAANGRVYAWGANVGQLGDGTTTNRPNPVAVLGPSGTAPLSAQTIAAGYNFALAVATDGSVLAWGNNQYGQLGDGTTTDRLLPVPVTLVGGAPLTGASGVAGGSTHALALTVAGAVFGWGDNQSGQLGDGTTTSRSRAAPVLNVSGVTMISAGDVHSLALGPDFPLATVTPQPTATPYVYQPPPTSAGTLFAISPVRVVDTRASDGNIVLTGFDQTGAPITAGPLQPGLVRRFKVAGQSFPAFTFPSSVKTLQLNVTIVNPAGGGSGGFVTIFPGDVPDGARPNASTLNPITPVAFNLWTTPVPLAPAANPGTFAAYSSTVPLDLVVDVTGYYQ